MTRTKHRDLRSASLRRAAQPRSPGEEETGTVPLLRAPKQSARSSTDIPRLAVYQPAAPDLATHLDLVATIGLVHILFASSAKGD
jgi:hypothetical protein